MTNSALPFPIQPKALPVPSDDGLGFHDAQGGAPIGPNSREPDPNESVTRSQSQTMVLVHALQQKKLMTECHVLRVQSGPSLKAAAKGEEQGSEEYEHSVAPYRKFNALNEHGFLGRDIQLVSYRQTKEPGTDRLAPKPPRHISTLPNGADRRRSPLDKPWSGKQNRA
jgi:hypothetical protein